MKEEHKAYMKAYYEAHKEDHKAKVKAWQASHKEHYRDYQKAYKEAHKDQAKAYRQAHKEQIKAWYQAHKEECKAYMKEYSKAHKDQAKAYMKSDVNSLGQTKHSIRMKSQCILKQMNLHIDGYEIHHCFGYEDASKFIYISKSLHLKIHKYLREHNIDASRDHWMHIRDLVNDTDEFMYIKC